MNKQVIENYSRLNYALFYFPLFVLLTIVVYLYAQNALHTNGYINIQKDFFLHLNSVLGRFPDIEYNLTQIGDALIFLSLLSVFIVYAPAIWESLISASLLSLVVSNGLKNLFSIPRPAAIFDTNSFIIIGQKLPGHNSLPSGHSITIFTTLTVLLFAFMPQKRTYKIMWAMLIVSIGLILAFTRVGVGAHYPLDVLVGSTVGYLSGITGIFISRKYKVWTWVGNKRSYPLFMLLLLACSVTMIIKIWKDPLPVYFLALVALIISLYKIVHVYFKK